AYGISTRPSTGAWIGFRSKGFLSVCYRDAAPIVTEHRLELARRFFSGLALCLGGGWLLLVVATTSVQAQAPVLAPPQNGMPPAFGGGASPEAAPAAGPRLVADVKILGNRAVPESKVYAQIRTRKDREFDPEMLQADVRRLVST